MEDWNFGIQYRAIAAEMSSGRSSERVTMMPISGHVTMRIAESGMIHDRKPPKRVMAR